MSMYLSNPDVGLTGVEPGEFIDFPPTAEELGTLGGGGRPATSADSMSQAVAHDAVADEQPTDEHPTMSDTRR